jgi:hypothetical protein
MDILLDRLQTQSSQLSEFMRSSPLLALMISLVTLAYGYYYYYVQTLPLSEVVGSTGNSTADILVNLFDFDTGLTRYDLYHLRTKCQEWSKRTEDIRRISDPSLQEAENTKLVAEMMQDQSFKKVAKKILGMGASSTNALLRAVSSYRALGLF